MNKDELYIKRTFDLARLGLGTVSPNPLVGCIIVYEDKVIGEGWHKQYGKSHAEVNAIESVADKSLLSKSTVYVNLEPCAHIGKTPPCANLLVSYGVKRVVIANLDINPLVAGQGLQRLEQAGIEVTTGVLEREGADLNKRFFTGLTKKRPYIILKWAQTTDGFIARKNFDSKWISDPVSRKLVHKWRTEEDAIMVGSNTARYDNPRLNARDWTGRDPVRILVDRHMKLNGDLHLFDRSQLTLCYNLISETEDKNLIFIKLNDKNFIEELLTDLYKRNIRSVIIEGGAKLLSLFIHKDAWDEARVFVSPTTFKDGIPAPEIAAKAEEKIIAKDKLLVYLRRP